MNLENMSIRQLIIELARTESGPAEAAEDPDRCARQRAVIRELRRRRQDASGLPRTPGSAAG